MHCTISLSDPIPPHPRPNLYSIGTRLGSASQACQSGTMDLLTTLTSYACGDVAIQRDTTNEHWQYTNTVGNPCSLAAGDCPPVPGPGLQLIYGQRTPVIQGFDSAPVGAGAFL